MRQSWKKSILVAAAAGMLSLTIPLSAEAAWEESDTATGAVNHAEGAEPAAVVAVDEAADSAEGTGQPEGTNAEGTGQPEGTNAEGAGQPEGTNAEGIGQPEGTNTEAPAGSPVMHMPAMEAAEQPGLSTEEKASEKKFGWKKEDGKWHYYFNDRMTCAAWVKVDGKWYYLDAEGALVTGWAEIGGNRYYLGRDGARCAGWILLNGSWYRFSADGVMLTGWQTWNGGWFFLGKDGRMTTGWKRISGMWYFFRDSGRMATGWVKSSGYWYYLDSAGHLTTGWKKINGKWYCFNGIGQMMKDTWIGEEYVGKDGVWQKDAVRQPSGKARLNVKCIYQNPELPNGCEVTSLAIALNYHGFNVSKGVLADLYLPRGRIGSTSPYDAYIGNPRIKNASWYCYSPVIVRCGNSYLSGQGSEYQAVDLTGQDFERLLVELDEGRPVIFWGTLSMGSPSYGSDWVIGGTRYAKHYNLHCLVLTGYDLEKNLVYVSDPLRGNVTYNLTTTKKRYEQMKKQAVVIKKKK